MSASNIDHVKHLLVSLRERPQDVEISDNILKDVYLYLMNMTFLKGEVHWFCDKADTTTIEAATFLIRLFAYDSEEVKRWKERLHKCVTTCVPCAQGLEQKKILSRQT
jgi:senataxin